jgi:hypothetical protein
VRRDVEDAVGIKATEAEPFHGVPLCYEVTVIERAAETNEVIANRHFDAGDVAAPSRGDGGDVHPILELEDAHCGRPRLARREQAGRNINDRRASPLHQPNPCGAPLVMVAEPAFAHQTLMSSAAPHLTAEQDLMVQPVAGLSSLLLSSLLKTRTVKPAERSAIVNAGGLTATGAFAGKVNVTVPADVGSCLAASQSLGI